MSFRPSSKADEKQSIGTFLGKGQGPLKQGASQRTREHCPHSHGPKGRDEDTMGYFPEFLAVVGREEALRAHRLQGAHGSGGKLDEVFART